MLFSLATGELLPGAVTVGDERAAEAPTGFGWVDGSHDHHCRRVDLATGQVIRFRPPPPLDTPLNGWLWVEEAERWVQVKTDLAVAAEVRRERDRRLAETSWIVERALESQAPVPQDWRAYRQALRDVPQQPGFPRSVVWPEPPG